MNKRIVLSAGCLATLSAIGLAHAQGKRPLRVVSEVDLARYAGQCYEIARYPNRFQKRCAGEVTAQYTLQPSGKISVLNRCRLENGGQIQAEGVARVVGKGQPNGNTFGFCRDRPRWTVPHTIDSSTEPECRVSTSAGCRRRGRPDPDL